VWPFGDNAQKFEEIATLEAPMARPSTA